MQPLPMSEALFTQIRGPLSVALHELCASKKTTDLFRAQCADLEMEPKDPFFRLLQNSVGQHAQGRVCNMEGANVFVRLMM